MKEIKVAVLTKEDVKELKELNEREKKLGELRAQYNSALYAFWTRLRMKYGLYSSNHYISGNSIYRQDSAE